MDTKKIGTFLATIRKEKGFTQKELANKIGVSNKAVSRWETGKGLPELSILHSLCNELGISIIEFINGERDSNNDKNEEVLKTIAYSNNEMKDKEKKYRKKVFILVCISLLAIFGIYFVYNNRPNENQIYQEIIEEANRKAYDRTDNIARDKLQVQRNQKGNSIYFDGIEYIDPGYYYFLEVEPRYSVDEQYLIMYHDGEMYNNYLQAVGGRRNIISRMIDDYNYDLKDVSKNILVEGDFIEVHGCSYVYDSTVIGKFEKGMLYYRGIDQIVDPRGNYYMQLDQMDCHEVANRLSNFYEYISNQGFKIVHFDIIVTVDQDIHRFFNVLIDDDNLEKHLEEAYEGKDDKIIQYYYGD